MNIENDKIILASQSPRRKQLLEQLGLRIDIHPSDIDETLVKTTQPKALVEELASLKACDIAKQYPDSWIIGADTIVVVNDKILGKPCSEKEAAVMLAALSNTRHCVYTAFCIMNQNSQTAIIKTVQTQVTFKSLSETEIQWYINTKEPFDKAGAYGIQGIGAFLVKRISGSYSNVVGLPVCEVFEALTALDIIQLET